MIYLMLAKVPIKMEGIFQNAKQAINRINIDCLCSMRRSEIKHFQRFEFHMPQATLYEIVCVICTYELNCVFMVHRRRINIAEHHEG